MHGIDIITKKEAEQLGIIGNLGKLNNKEVFAEINRKLIELLKKDNLMWQKPWRDGIKLNGMVYGPHNYETLRPYHGFNAMNIALYQQINNWTENAYLTLKQAEARGGNVKNVPGIWVFAYIKNEKEIEVDGKKIINIRTGIVSYKVYPIHLIEGLKPINRKEKPQDLDSEEIIIDAEKIIENMPKRPPIANGGSEAFYVPSQDRVQMPLKKAFKTINQYYSTLFHELIHSTGHEKRVGRPMKGRFGDKDYAFEELIAEIGAAYICGVAGIDYYTLNNSAAYLKSWSRKLIDIMSADNNFYYRAVIAATRAAKYIIGETIVKENKGKGKTKTTEKKEKPTEKKKIQ